MGQAHTISWEWVERDAAVEVVCPVCKQKYVCRISQGTPSKTEMPKHGKPPELECIGGGKRYK